MGVCAVGTDRLTEGSSDSSWMTWPAGLRGTGDPPCAAGPALPFPYTRRLGDARRVLEGQETEQVERVEQLAVGTLRQPLATSRDVEA
jgi:hypothetical protein